MCNGRINPFLDTFSVWLPFVEITTLNIEMSDTNNLKIFLEFVLNKDLDTVESVQVEIGE